MLGVDFMYKECNPIMNCVLCFLTAYIKGQNTEVQDALFERLNSECKHFYHFNLARSHFHLV